MTQTNFGRGLDQGFVKKLNELYDQSDSWWRALVDDDDLFLSRSRQLYKRLLSRLQPSQIDVETGKRRCCRGNSLQVPAATTVELVRKDH